MMLDFYKLAELILPNSLRNNKFLAFIRILVAMQMQALFAKYHLFRLRSKLDSSTTPQVCSLQYGVEQIFDVQCDIRALSGKPYDFLVSIDRSTDLNAIRAFVDKHKLAGKSFVFELGDISYSATWSNYVDENLVDAYSATWSNYVDEDDGVVIVSVSSVRSGTAWRIDVNSSRAVGLDLSIEVIISYRQNSQPQQQIGLVNLATGQSASSTILFAGTPTTSIISASEYTISDDIFEYQILNG